MNEYLIKKLKEGRMNKGLKQSDVTQITGIKNTTLSNYENGVTEPDMDTFLQLCELYELDFVSIIEEAYGINTPNKDFSPTSSEIEFLKQYRALDEESKELVNSVIANALRISEERAPKEGQLLLSSTPGYMFDIVENGKIIPWITESVYDDINAAHARTDKTNTPADIQHDEKIMDDENF